MNKERHLLRFNTLKFVHEFFREEGFLETPTPPMVQNPGMETHIHPFQIKSVVSKEDKPFYLHTSPEFAMKELLSLGFEKIYNVSYCFRDEPYSETHRPQFLMLEWYRKGASHTDIMDDCEKLITHLCKKLDASPRSFLRKSVEELFKEFCDLSILELETRDQLLAAVREKNLDVPTSGLHEMDWDDIYFLVWLNIIEPQLKNYPALIVHGYPASMAALSTINPEDPRICDRFELYLDGVEVANCFNELTDVSAQNKRFKDQAIQKKKLYGYELPEPREFYNSMERGLPDSAGIALGIERLAGALSGKTIPFWS